MAFPSIDTGVPRHSSGITSPPQKTRSRTQSLSSDRPSTIGHGLMTPPLSVSPEAAFIAASAASQIVTNDHDSHADAWYDQHGIEPSGETALVSPGALQLVNNFLDQLLFNFLSISRSTTLSTLRPAVTEVLKPKLAKDAINQADEELHEYLGGGDDDDFMPAQTPTSARDWDLELVWKRTRLRCMVYSSLGDMEEEDEDYYMEQGHLDSELDDDRLGEAVSPAVAIFLTSILEFMGEQALVVAGQAAYHRLRVKYEKELKGNGQSPTDVADRIVVEELDMERVALDRTLGRLWRAWKKKIRSPAIGADHQPQSPLLRDSLRGTFGNHLRQSSLSAESSVPPTVPEPEPAQDTESKDESADKDELCEDCRRAAAERDADESEAPGLASNGDGEDDEDETEDEPQPPRPKSIMIIPMSGGMDLPTPTMSQPHTPVTARKRSNSLPTPAASPFMSPPKRSKRSKIDADGIKHRDQAESGEGRAEIASQEDNARELKSAESGLPEKAFEVEAADAEEVSTQVHDEVPDTEHERSVSSGPVAAAVAGAAAVVTAVGTAVVAAPSVSASEPGQETEHEESEHEEADDIEDFTEEPQILTSSRISIGGRTSPAASSLSEQSKPMYINTHPARSGSVHSLRLIEVQSPRSPVTGSRNSSVDASDRVSGSRSANLSRTNSVSRTPPIVEENAAPSEGWAAQGALTAMLPRPSRISSESISEAEEAVDAVSPLTPVLDESGPESLPRPDLAGQREQLESRIQESQPIFGSAIRARSPPRSPPQPVTKVTILSQPTSSQTFFIDEKSEARPKPNAYPPVPALPDRSFHRHANGASPGGMPPPTIGAVSVDRSIGRRESSADQSATRPADLAPSGPRQLHTSGSSTSSGTNRLKAVRNSEDTAPSRAESVARNFEELIHSDQTIQYTLTPESMRDIDSQSSRSGQNGSPVISVKTRKSEDARRDGNRSRSGSDNHVTDLKRATSLSRSAGLSSHPVNELPVVVRPPGSIPRSHPAVPPKTRGVVAQARDARLPRESVAEFASFIRSTGPAAEPEIPAGRPSASGTVRNFSGPVPKASIESGRVSTTSNPNRSRLQARDAAVDYRDDNSDLIDFIRRGPPSTGNPRIPRTVAPFRSTMDSDQMVGAVGGKAIDATIPEIRSSQASTNVTEMSSVQSSINSQSALLGKNRPSPPQNHGRFDDDDMMPKRKTRRVRDPYAIDLSDEEEEDEMDLPAPPKRAQTQEESLIDFLRNVPPPPEPTVVPFHIQEAQNRPKKKASAPSLMARFAGRRDSGRSASISSIGGGQGGKTDARSLNSRAGSINGRRSNYVPIQVNMNVSNGGGEKYGTQNHGPAGVASGGRGVAPPRNGGRVLMKKYEPREAVQVPARGTSDLAEFLRNSEPPTGHNGSYPPSPSQEDGAFSKVFARRKKSSVA